MLHTWCVLNSFPWMAKKNEKPTVNPKNGNGHMYLKYTIMVALNHEKIKNDLQRI